jgi:hypothetical protein
MRCKACDIELVLTNVVRDAVPGFEHHSFLCSQCHRTERRVVFMRHGREDDDAPMSIHAAPPIVPASTDEHTAARSIIERVVARMRGH